MIRIIMRIVRMGQRLSKLGAEWQFFFASIPRGTTGFEAMWTKTSSLDPNADGKAVQVCLLKNIYLLLARDWPATPVSRFLTNLTIAGRTRLAPIFSAPRAKPVSTSFLFAFRPLFKSTYIFFFRVASRTINAPIAVAAASHETVCSRNDLWSFAGKSSS